MRDYRGVIVKYFHEDDSFLGLRHKIAHSGCANKFLSEVIFRVRC